MRLESALEVIGALKDRFGEAMTATDVCRAVALSYQPVYEIIRQLREQGAVTVGKRGQRLLCEPAASPAGSLWLAQCSAEELRRARGSALRELVAALEGRITADVAAGELVAFDPGSDPAGTVYATDAAPFEGLSGTRLRVARRGEWAEVLRGPKGDWGVARRLLPLCAQQQIWALALSARGQEAATPPVLPPHPALRRREFID